MSRTLCALAALLAASAAGADELRALCADRPGLGTPACTVDAGHAVFELGIADFSRERDGDRRSDTLLVGDALLRFGLDDTLEAQIGWTAYGRRRERSGGVATQASRFGDLQVALRRNLRSPDGSGVSVALMPYAQFATGREPIGAADWSAGLVVPIGIDLGGGSLAFTPSVDAVVDSDGHGRHLGYGSVVGWGFDCGDALSASVELSLYRDRDPAGASTQRIAGLSLAWQPPGRTGRDPSSQWDIGSNVGLDKASPDVELYVGYVRRF